MGQALSTPLLHYSPIHLASSHHVASNEVHESWCCQGNDKGCSVEGDCHGARLENEGCSNVLNSLVTVAAKEVKKTGVFAVPGLCRIKTRPKPATKACTKMIFGKETKVKAKPAKTVVKAFPVAALKKQI